MAKDEVAQAARLMAKRRDKKLGRRGLSNMAFSGARSKDRLYGIGWAKRVQRGLPLVPIKNLPPFEGEK